LETITAGVFNLVEDGDGNVDLLAVYNFDPLLKPHQVLPKNTILAIKEPYYESFVGGGVGIRIDHPSDRVRLPRTHASVPPAFTAGLGQTHTTAAEHKNAGNDAYSKHGYLTALHAYELALDTCPDAEVKSKHEILRSYASAKLHLKRFEPALDDAKRAMVPEGASNLNLHAYLSAGRAAYELRQYTEAKSHFKHALACDPDDQNARRELQKTSTRLAEAQHRPI
jgi:tetratricopeptide (TPR) repeat protein